MGESGDFSINLVWEILKSKKEDEAEKSVQTKKSKKKQPIVKEEPFDPAVPPFFCTKDRILLKKGKVETLTIDFFPLILERHLCKIIFLDPQVGEFQHEILADVQMPSELKEYNPSKLTTINVDVSYQLPIAIAPKNELITSLKKAYKDKLYNSGKMKERDIFLQKIQNEKKPEIINFDVEIVQANPSFITTSPVYSIVDTSRKIKEAQKEKEKKDEQKKTTSDTSFESKVKIFP